jgi:putative ABC transport system permease protein
MNATRLITTSLRTIVRFKLRSAFMALGTLVGVAALTLVVSVGTAAERKILATVRQLFSASSVLVINGGGRMMRGPRSDGARLTLDDLGALASTLPAIETWDPMKVLDQTQVRYGNATATVRVVGSSERAERVWDRSVSRGEYFDASAVGRSARVALIGETTARQLFSHEDPLGAEILIGSVPFRVMGVLQPFGTDAHGMDRDNEIVVPISTAMRRVQNSDTISGAKLLVRDPARVSETAREVRRLLRERHALAASQPDDFTIMTPVQVQRLVARAQRVFFVFLPLVAAVSLVAGGVVAASLMLFSVNERTGEIGLRRALGARPRDIARQFLLETALTTLAGGAGGALVGCAGALLVASRMGLESVVSWPAIALGLVLAAATGLVAGVLPARRAARLQPAEALR